jgi:uncharacterized HhH-GPD family protein
MLRHAFAIPGTSRIDTMPDALWFTDDPKAAELLAQDPFALLVGFAIDQQVPVQKAFAGPYVLKQRAGTLDPKKLAAIDLAPLFAEKPAIHRFPGSMAERVRDLAQVVSEDYGGDASRIWTEAKDADDLKNRLGALPGFGPMKITGLGATLALRFGVETAKPLVPSHPCLGNVDSPAALEEYQAAKRAHKAALRAGNA